LMSTGFRELDYLMQDDAVTEFFSTSYPLLTSFYHLTVVESAPVGLLVVGERGGLNPYALLQLARALGKEGIGEAVYLRRAFKAEDVPDSVSAFSGPLIVVDPYHHGKLGDRIAGAIKERGDRTLLFSFGDRRRFGSAFGWHVATSVFFLREVKGGFKVKLVKSPVFPEVELSYSTGSLFGQAGDGLFPWLLGGQLAGVSRGYAKGALIKRRAFHLTSFLMPAARALV
jgi:hypothetical protein